MIKRLKKLFLKNISYQITKRHKLVVMSFVLTVLLVITQTVNESYRFQTVGILAAVTVLLSIFTLWGELSGIKYFLLLLLPIYFVAGASLFYFLLPVRWLTRLPFAFLFGISVYLLMLTSNIYNVAAIRTIALLRAAHAVGLLFSLITTFFLVNVLFSLHFPFYFVVLGSAVITFPLYLIGLWSYELEEYISKKVLIFALIFTLVSAELALILSFAPIVPINGALFLATVMYVLLGIGRFEITNKLTPRIVWEHLTVSLVVFLIILTTTRWGG